MSTAGPVAVISISNVKNSGFIHWVPVLPAPVFFSVRLGELVFCTIEDLHQYCDRVKLQMIFGYHGMNEVGVKSLLWVRSLIVNYYTHKKSPGANSPC